MSVSVVVGGQYGSEGKGKVALELVRRDPSITIVVRPGGTNSGHTGYNRDGQRFVLRQLPAAAVDRNVTIVLPAGSYVDEMLLHKEISDLEISLDKILIDFRAHVIQPEHLEWEAKSALTRTIGSTGSGTGAAVLSRLARNANGLPKAIPASDCPSLKPFLADTQSIMTEASKAGQRILIEGTQGYGLSPLHTNFWPHCTSRDTTAAAFVSEAGVSPLWVDEIVMVLRYHPIRVAGDSGPLAQETSWNEIRKTSGAEVDITEFTSVTNNVRRVGHFDLDLARRALDSNCPTKLVLNHLDYVDWRCRNGVLTPRCYDALVKIEEGLRRNVDWIGINETTIIDRQQVSERVRAA